MEDEEIISKIDGVASALAARIEQLLVASQQSQELLEELRVMLPYLSEAREIAAKRLPLTHEMTRYLKEKYGLTRRETEVAYALLVLGSIKDVSAQLSISSNTVKAHIRKLFDKLGVGTRHDLVLKLLTENLAE